MPLLGCDGQAKICQSANQWTANFEHNPLDLSLFIYDHQIPAFVSLFALLLGPAMAQHTSAAPKSPHGMFDILSDQVSESQPCWNNPAIDGVRWRGGWNRIQKPSTEVSRPGGGLTGSQRKWRVINSLAVHEAVAKALRICSTRSVAPDRLRK